MANKDPLITVNTIIQRNSEHLLTSEVGEELVMMDIDGGNYISLNKTGRIIWEQIKDPLSVTDIIKILISRFNVQEDECIADILAYLQNMLAQKVICITK